MNAFYLQIYHQHTTELSVWDGGLRSCLAKKTTYIHPPSNQGLISLRVHQGIGKLNQAWVHSVLFLQKYRVQIGWRFVWVGCAQTHKRKVFTSVCVIVRRITFIVNANKIPTMSHEQ